MCIHARLRGQRAICQTWKVLFCCHFLRIRKNTRLKYTKINWTNYTINWSRIVPWDLNFPTHFLEWFRNVIYAMMKLTALVGLGKVCTAGVHTAGFSEARWRVPVIRSGFPLTKHIYPTTSCSGNLEDPEAKLYQIWVENSNTSCLRVLSGLPVTLLTQLEHRRVSGRKQKSVVCPCVMRSHRHTHVFDHAWLKPAQFSFSATCSFGAK